MLAVLVVRPIAFRRGGGVVAMRSVRRVCGSPATSRRAKSGGTRENSSSAAVSHCLITSGLRGRESGAIGRAGRCRTIRGFPVSLVVSEEIAMPLKKGVRGIAALAVKASTM